MPEIGPNLKKYMIVYYSLWLTLKKIWIGIFDVAEYQNTSFIRNLQRYFELIEMRFFYSNPTKVFLILIAL